MNQYAFDPFDHKQTQNQWDLLKALRDHAPVSRPIPGFVYVARHADVAAIFKDIHENFSSAEGFRGKNVVVPIEESFLGEIDRPLHRELRGLMMQVFKPGLEKKAEGFARHYISALWQNIKKKGGGDLVADFGLNIPSAVTSHLLGISADNIERVGQWGFDLVHSTWPETNATKDGVGLGGAFPDIATFLDDQIDQRRKETDASDDMITRMIQAKIEIDGENSRGLSDLQIRTLCANVLLASLSTANLIGNLLLRFVSNTNFENALRADPSLIPGAVEESLRVEPPVLFMMRTAKNDCVIADEPIAKGERILLGIASGNRDERVFKNADEFQLNRANAKQHLTFAPGIHRCLGNQLARMEARVALETAIEIFPPGSMRLHDDFVFEHVPMFLEFGPSHLDAVFED